MKSKKITTFFILFMGFHLFEHDNIPLKNKNKPTEKFKKGLQKTCANPEGVLCMNTTAIIAKPRNI